MSRDVNGKNEMLGSFPSLFGWLRVRMTTKQGQQQIHFGDDKQERQKAKAKYRDPSLRSG
jgi:hypothetical protein